MGGMQEEIGMHTVALVQEVNVVQENQASLLTVEMAQGEGWYLNNYCLQTFLMYLFYWVYILPHP